MVSSSFEYAPLLISLILGPVDDERMRPFFETDPGESTYILNYYDTDDATDEVAVQLGSSQSTISSDEIRLDLYWRSNLVYSSAPYLPNIEEHEGYELSPV